jgi:hypothetical protein
VAHGRIVELALALVLLLSGAASAHFAGCRLLSVGLRGSPQLRIPERRKPTDDG